MRTLDVTSVTDDSEMPIKSGTLQFLQDSYTELINGIVRAIVQANGGFDLATVYVLYGCTNSSSTDGVYNIADGLMFHNLTLYFVDATAFTTAAGLTAVCNINQTQYAGNGINADPVTFSDTVERNIHDINKIVVTQGVSGSSSADYSAVKFISLTIPPQLVLTAPASVGGVGNIAQVLGVYPQQQIFVPNTSQLGQVLALGNVNVGDVPTGGVTVSVTFPALPSGTNYRVALTIVSSSGNPLIDTTFSCSVINSTKSLSGFSIRCQEWTAETQNASIDWIIFKA